MRDLFDGANLQLGMRYFLGIVVFERKSWHKPESLKEAESASRETGVCAGPNFSDP